ncbi:MAG: Wzz/FepE/Etk N-terminal domain-containing protein [Hyphomicrobium sp.]
MHKKSVHLEPVSIKREAPAGGGASRRSDIDEVAKAAPAAVVAVQPAEPVPQPASNAISELLAIFWRRKAWASLPLVMAVVVGTAFQILKTPQYASTALIQLDLQSGNAPGKGSAPTAMIDAGSLVESQTRLIESEALARRVVERLGLDKIEQPTGLAQTLTTFFGVAHADGRLSPAPVDLATSRLLDSLSVKNDTRTYLISVTANALHPDEAARVANAFASEFIHHLRLQDLSGELSSAEHTVANLGQTLGYKHPQMIKANSALGAARARFEVVKNDARLLSEAELADSGQVIPARPVTLAKGARLSTILLVAALVGLGLGLLLVNLLERRALRACLLRHFSIAAV